MAQSISTLCLATLCLLAAGCLTFGGDFAFFFLFFLLDDVEEDDDDPDDEDDEDEDDFDGVLTRVGASPSPAADGGVFLLSRRRVPRAKVARPRGLAAVAPPF
jgi:hypothetical protein